MAPVWHLAERDRLASELAKRIWLAHGGQPGSDLRSQGILLLLEAMLARYLDEGVVQASLGLRYLETLSDNVCRADYEDARLLADEARWVELYLHKELRCPLLRPADGPLIEDVPDRASVRRERLHAALIALAETELRAAGVAA